MRSNDNRRTTTGLASGSVWRTGAMAVLLATLIPSSASADAAATGNAVRSIADRAWSWELEAFPQRRAQLGLPVEEATTVTLAHHARGVDFARSILRDLDRLSEADLDEDSRLTVATLREHYGAMVGHADDYWLEFSIVPYNANYDFALVHNELRANPLATAADRARYLRLARSYGRLVKQHHEKLRLQEQRGIRLSQSAIASVLEMLSGLKTGLATNLRPSSERLAAMPEDGRSQFAEAVDKAVRDEAEPALSALTAYLEGPYRTRAPIAPGVGQYPGGRAYYARLVQDYTTTDVSPEALHRLGQQRVAELSQRIARRASELGIKGTTKEIFAQLRQDRRYIPQSPEQIAEVFARNISAIEPLVDRYFCRRPAAPYGVTRLSPIAEKGMTFGFYSAPTPAEPRGLYHYNASNLENRTLLNSRSLIYHELIPGHHFQIARQLENKSLHPFRANYGTSAFGEGWGEYAASLGYEMGLYKDAPDELGRLIAEIFMASRLVVDTGIGYYGWSLDEAKRYMRDHLFQSDTEIATEVVRYATIPGQALSYRVGSEKIWELRRKAEAELGSSFDIRLFHEAVIGAGVLPLRSVEARVARYIAAAKASPSAARDGCGAGSAALQQTSGVPVPPVRPAG